MVGLGRSNWIAFFYVGLSFVIVVEMISLPPRVSGLLPLRGVQAPPQERDDKGSFLRLKKNEC